MRAAIAFFCLCSVAVADYPFSPISSHYGHRGYPHYHVWTHGPYGGWTRTQELNMWGMARPYTHFRQRYERQRVLIGGQWYDTQGDRNARVRAYHESHFRGWRNAGNGLYVR